MSQYEHFHGHGVIGHATDDEVAKLKAAADADPERHRKIAKARTAQGLPVKRSLPDGEWRAVHRDK